MIFLSGKTTCPYCRDRLDSTDDIVEINVNKIDFSPSLPENGFYHSLCFDALPNRKKYLNYFRENIHEYLKEQQNIWDILELGERFALAYVPFSDTVMIYFFTLGRTIPITCSNEAWKELCNLILGVEPRKLFYSLKDKGIKSDHERFTLRVDIENKKILFEIKDGTNKLLRFTREQFNVINYYAPNSIKEGRNIDFAKVCSQVQIYPILTDGFLKNAKGVIDAIEENKKHITIHIIAERCLRIILSLNEFNELRSLIDRLS